MIGKKYSSQIFWACLGIVFFFSACLYYSEATGRITSDLFPHMEAGAENTGYSLLHLLFYPMSQSSSYGLFVSVFLATCIIATVLVTRQLIRENVSSESLDMRFVNFFALTLCLVSMIVLPEINQYWYLGQSTPNPWHNPTHVLCRVFGVLTVLFFIRIYKKGLFASRLDLLYFAMSLTLATFAKPSFPSIFMPAVMTILITDWFLYKKRETVLMILSMGVLFLPSVALVLYQSVIVFVQDDQGTLVFTLGRAWRVYSQNVPLSVLSAFAFPLFVFFTKRQSSILYKLCLTSFLYSVLAYTFMGEDGARASHLNMGWGLMLGSFFAFVASAVVLIEKRQEKRWAKWASVLYALHLVSGIAYIARYMLLGIYV